MGWLEELLKQNEVTPIDNTPIPMRSNYDRPLAPRPIKDYSKLQASAFDKLDGMYTEDAPKVEETVSITDTPLVLGAPQLEPKEETTYQIKSPLVKDYMMSKAAPAQSAPAVAGELEEEPRPQGLSKLGYALQVLSAGFGGRDPLEPVKRYYSDLDNMGKSAEEKKEKQRKNKMEDTIFGEQVKGFKKLDDMDNPDSELSKRGRAGIEASRFSKIKDAYGDRWQYVTANDIKNILDIEKIGAEIDHRKDQIDYLRGQKRGASEDTLEGRKILADIEKTKAEAEKLRRVPVLGQAAKKLTPAQIEADKAGGKMYADWVHEGNRNMIMGDIETLKKVERMLETRDDLTGPIAGNLPWKSFTNAEGKDVEDLVAGITQKDLRRILGGQFASKEGEQLLTRGFDKSQEEKINLSRVRKLRKAMEQAAAAKDAVAKEFEEQGTLIGFKGNYGGPVPDAPEERMVTIIAPNGKPKKIPESQVQSALNAGGKLMKGN